MLRQGAGPLHVPEGVPRKPQQEHSRKYPRSIQKALGASVSNTLQDWYRLRVLTCTRDGGTFRGKWSFNEARQRWEGNPADSAEVYDVMASVKHKASAEGGDRTHSMAMTKDFMDRMLQWHEAACPLEIALQAIQLVMSGTLPSQVQLTLDTRTQLTRHLEQVTFDAGAWTLWSRYCPTCRN